MRGFFLLATVGSALLSAVPGCQPAPPRSSSAAETQAHEAKESPEQEFFRRAAEPDEFAPRSDEEIRRENEEAQRASRMARAQREQEKQARAGERERKRKEWVRRQQEEFDQGPPDDPRQRSEFYRRHGYRKGPDGKKLCGSPLPNPHAQWNSADRDGSCRTCEHAPQEIPACAPGKAAMTVTSQTLQSNLDRVVSFRGSYGYRYYRCTAKGGPCACANTCGGKLALFPLGRLPQPMSKRKFDALWAEDPVLAQQADIEHTKRSDAVPHVIVALKEKPQGDWPYASEGGLGLYCGGDEGSMCCPYRFTHQDQWVNVIVTGRLVEREGHPQGPVVPHLVLGSMCRLD